MNVVDSSGWLEYMANGPNAAAFATPGVENKLPLADSIIFATARAYGAILWTQDADFQGLPDVHYLKK